MGSLNEQADQSVEAIPLSETVKEVFMAQRKEGPSLDHAHQEHAPNLEKRSHGELYPPLFPPPDVAPKLVGNSY